MKRIIYITAIALLAFSCHKKKIDFAGSQNKIVIPNVRISTSDHRISTKNDTVFLNENKFSGYLFAMNPENIDTVALSSYINGVLEGTSKKWYDDGGIQEVRIYSNGRKNGPQVSFWPNGNKKFEFIAKDDVYEGEMKEWNYNGTLFHLANFKNGQEFGTQKLWYDNGKIRANYVMINGKRYGLLGTKNCTNVSDSIFNIN
jgi:antitoxin component YwqK of YwqJK toxin-antitoxin module